jgi:EamA-like transporter family
VICTAIAFLVFFRLIAEVGPARATVITYVNPAVAVALGVLVLGEHLTPAIGAAFVLILGGSVLATRPGSGRGGRPPAGHEVAEDGAPPPVRTNLDSLITERSGCHVPDTPVRLAGGKGT